MYKIHKEKITAKQAEMLFHYLLKKKNATFVGFISGYAFCNIHTYDGKTLEYAVVGSLSLNNSKWREIKCSDSCDSKFKQLVMRMFELSRKGYHIVISKNKSFFEILPPYSSFEQTMIDVEMNCIL